MTDTIPNSTPIPENLFTHKRSKNIFNRQIPGSIPLIVFLLGAILCTIDFSYAAKNDHTLGAIGEIYIGAFLNFLLVILFAAGRMYSDKKTLKTFVGTLAILITICLDAFFISLFIYNFVLNK